MTLVPLVSHSSLDSIIAWHSNTPVKLRQFIADVEHLVSLLPEG